MATTQDGSQIELQTRTAPSYDLGRLMFRDPDEYRHIEPAYCYIPVQYSVYIAWMLFMLACLAAASFSVLYTNYGYIVLPFIILVILGIGAAYLALVDKKDYLLIRFLAKVFLTVIRRPSSGSWRTFWSFCMVAFPSQTTYDLFLKCWLLKHPQRIISIGTDKQASFMVPIPEDIQDDYGLIQQLDFFTNFLSYSHVFEQPISSIFKTVVRIDINKLDAFGPIGEAIFTIDPKDLDKKKIPWQSNRIVNAFQQHGLFEDPCLIDLVREGKTSLTYRQICRATRRWKGLTRVKNWNSGRIMALALFLLILSAGVCVIWPAVAVKKYGADVQSSVQAATGLAGYLLTAGAFLIALNAGLDILTPQRSSRAYLLDWSTGASLTLARAASIEENATSPPVSSPE